MLGRVVRLKRKEKGRGKAVRSMLLVEVEEIAEKEVLRKEKR